MLVNDDALNGILLGCTEYSTVTFGATTTGWAYRSPATFFEPVDGASYCWVGQSGQLNDLHDLDALLVQSHHLLAQLVELLQGLLSRAFFFPCGFDHINHETFKIIWAESIRLQIL